MFDNKNFKIINMYLNDNFNKSYDIFNDLDDYLTIVLEVNKYEQNTTSQFCNSISLNYSHNNQIIELCRKFVSFFNNLKSNYKSDSSPEDNKKYSEYLNFWVRHQLELQSISKTDKLVLYKHLQDNYQQLDEDSKLKNKLYNINDNDFKSMNMLYELYKNYNGPLSDYNDDCNNFLKKFKHNELKDLIWLQYNMSFHYDEEKKKTYMMKVLYQFIFYCNENKKNLKLSLFMKEFIRKYYTTNEAEYKEIFTECEGKDNKEIYGQWYKNCKEKFGKDILLIRDNANSYVQQQENYIKELPTLDLLILKAKALFQDSESMSKYSTTIISIMISIFLCLFFLYKVLKSYI
ncbi:hypothetical protein PVNG_05018 [Plasmodium vivax North Korean]|uniref:Variable surface protein n=1 Tax=Plasmodium vivax North Korean TaxID=1035514 RepID=A0A0J9U0W5_PLAVI|nr:hypothetical protein PVNG_05018 [Plasmodium vivax North Korean]